MGEIEKNRTKTHKTCSHCGKVLPKEKFGNKGRLCNQCKYIKYIHIYKKAKKKPEELMVSDKPGRYKRGQFDMVYEFLTALEWNYDKGKNRFYKDGVKDRNNKWAYQNK